MSTKRTYKNVYTILEKVKKGEIKTGHGRPYNRYEYDSDSGYGRRYSYEDGYSSSYYGSREGGLFGKLDFYKKPDLIKPYLHYIDNLKLERIVKETVTDSNVVKKLYEKYVKTSKFQQTKEAIDFNKYCATLSDIYNNMFPKHMIQDVFKLYYNKVEKLEFEQRTDANYSKYKFLEKSNNPVGKIMTEHSNFKSTIYTKNIILHFLAMMTELKFNDPKGFNDLMKNLSDKNGSSGFDQNDIDDCLEKAFNDNHAKESLNEAMNEAQQTCAEFDKHIDKDVQERIFDSVDESTNQRSTAGKFSPDYLKLVASELKKISLSMNGLKDKIKKLLDKSVNYFSAKTVVKYEDLFNAEDISGLEEFHLLHPGLRKIFAEDIQVKDTKNVGKIDVYIDISGSMSSGCGAKNIDGSYVSRLDFCKALTAKLLEIDLLNKVYLFNTTVKPYRNDIISISMITTDGGTSIDSAVRSIEKNNNNAIILTDAEDRCSIYSDKAYFIGLEGSRFNSFSNDVLEKYTNKEQIVIFNGSTIKKVNSQGKAV